MNPLAFLGRDLALDLGAATTQIHVPGRGIVHDEPSAVARTPEDAAGTPPEDGDHAVRLITHVVTKVHGHPFARPRLVMPVPSDATPVQRDALRDLAYQAAARRVTLVEQELAAALGAGLPVHDPAGRMIADIGPRLTRVALLACGTVIATRTLRTGGDAATAAIAALAAREHGLLVGRAEAEAVKRRTGPFWKPPGRYVIARGLDPESRQARVAWVPVQQLYEVTKAPAEAIARAVAAILESCPAELSADVAAHGMVLTGGGALLRGLPRRLRATMGIPVRRAPHPVHATVLGLARRMTLSSGVSGRWRLGRELPAAGRPEVGDTV